MPSPRQKKRQLQMRCTAKREAEKSTRMRLRRMNKSSNVGDAVGAYPGTMCPKFDAPQQYEKFQSTQTHQGEFCSGPGTRMCRKRGTSGAIVGTRANGQC